jgi:hypothetical protein
MHFYIDLNITAGATRLNSRSYMAFVGENQGSSIRTWSPASGNVLMHGTLAGLLIAARPRVSETPAELESQAMVGVVKSP